MSDSELSGAPFGRKFCDIPGYTDCWVQFKTSGYPRKLRREWDAAKEDSVTWEIIARYIAAWNIKDIDGGAVQPSADYAVVDNLEDAVVVWIVKTFQRFWLVELLTPRPNS